MPGVVGLDSLTPVREFDLSLLRGGCLGSVGVVEKSVARVSVSKMSSTLCGILFG